MSDIVWTPQPKQQDFLERWEDVALYGGAAGGGKSESLVIDALRQVNIPHYRALILRKTYKQLTELIDKTWRYYPRAYPGAEYNKTDHVWTFPSGAQVQFGSLQHENNKYDYQGRSYEFLAFDELTQFAYEEFSYLLGRNRANGKGSQVYCRATANPGGVGHGWVKDMFVTAATPGETFWQKYQVMQPDGTIKELWKSSVFIPSSVFDNKILLDNDPAYLMRLASLPEAEKKALLYGDWDSFQGAFWNEFKNDPAHYEDRQWTHVIAPFDVPPEWTIVRSYDHGRSRPFSVGWHAIDHDGVAYRILEWYGCSGTPDEGLFMDAGQIFREVARIESTHRWLKGKKINGVADPSIFSHSGTGPSVAEIAAEQGIYFVPGNNDRLNGWDQMHYRFAFDDNGYPRYYIFNNCKSAIRTIPTMIYSESGCCEDMETRDVEDHICDEIRYFAMSRPVLPLRRPAPDNFTGKNPASIYLDIKKEDLAPYIPGARMIIGGSNGQ